MVLGVSAVSPAFTMHVALTMISSAPHVIAAMLAQDNSFAEADCPARFGELQATQSKGNHLRVKPERQQPFDCDRGPPRARANGNLAIAYGP